MTPKELDQAKLGIGTRLREARIAKGITQKKLAGLAGTNQAVIQKIENGRSSRPRVTVGLAIVLDVHPASLDWGEPFAPKRVDTAGEQILKNSHT